MSIPRRLNARDKETAGFPDALAQLEAKFRETYDWRAEMKAEEERAVAAKAEEAARRDRADQITGGREMLGFSKGNSAEADRQQLVYRTAERAEEDRIQAAYVVAREAAKAEEAARRDRADKTSERIAEALEKIIKLMEETGG